MIRCLKHMIVSISLLLATIAPGTAQSLDEMRAQLKAMQKRIDQLELEQKRAAQPAPVAHVPSRAPVKTAQHPAASQPANPPPATPSVASTVAAPTEAQAQQDAIDLKAAVAAEIKATYTPPPGKPGGLTVKIPGTDSTVRLYGFVKLNAISDLTTFDAADC